MTRVFLSYGRADDPANGDSNHYHDPAKSFMRRLYDDLKGRGFELWWDQVDMPGRALTFLQAIRDAITGCDRLIVVAGPGAMDSEYVRAEWRYALEICLPVNPILRKGEYSILPPELKNYDTPDFRESAGYERALEKLTRQISQAPAPPGRLHGVPPLPQWYVERGDDLKALVEAVCADTHKPIVITSKQQTVALVGLGGIGKTTLAKALSRDCNVRRAFPDGVFWLEIGPEATPATLATRMGDVGAALGDSREEYPDLGRGKSRLGALLVLDDVWDHQHAEAFRVVGGRCRIVVATRQGRIANKLGVPPQHIDTLTAEEGLALIGARLGRAPGAANPHERAEREIVKLLGGHTLAISIAAARIFEQGADYAPKLLERLRKRQGSENPFRDLAMDDKDKNYNLELSLAESYDDLAEGAENRRLDMQRRFRELGVFAAEGSFDSAAAGAVWGDGDEDDTEDALNILVRAGLAQYTSPAGGISGEGGTDGRRYSQHNLLRAYARALLARAGELEAAQERHFAHYEERHGDHDANNDETRHPLITPDFENIREALAWGNTHAAARAVDFARALVYYMQLNQSYATRREVLAAAHEAAVRADYAFGQAHTLRALGALDVREAAYPAARARYEQALGLYEAIPDRLGQAHTLHALGALERAEGNSEAA